MNIAHATPFTTDWVNGKTIEQYYDKEGLASIGIKPVKKTAFLELSAKNGWDTKLTKPEDLAIINDSTIAVGIDNDYGIESTHKGVVSASGIDPVIYIFSLKGKNKISHFAPPVNSIHVAFDEKLKAQK